MKSLGQNACMHLEIRTASRSAKVMDPFSRKTIFNLGLQWKVPISKPVSLSAHSLKNFQEESSVKLFRFAVLALLVLGCSAAFAQNYSFGFQSYDGSIQYCDYETLTVSAPYAAGTHVLTSCGLPL